MNGWWKFHRKMDQHAVWSLSDGQFKVWIAILNLANHKDQDWWTGTDRVTVPSGSFITSLKHLAQYSRTSIKTVRLTFESLCKIGSIQTQIRAQRYTQITLVNAMLYRGTDEDEGTEKGTLGAQQGHSQGTAGALTGEGKKERRKRKEEDQDTTTTSLALLGPSPWPSVEALIALYNTRSPDYLSRVVTLNTQRRNKTKAYLAKYPNLAWWEEVFSEYRLSRFLLGLERSNGHTHFMPDFDWLLQCGRDKLDNCMKVHDGKYRDGSQRTITTPKTQGNLAVVARFLKGETP